MQFLKTCWIALRCAFYGMLSYMSFDDIVNFLKNPAALSQTAPARAHCFGYWNPFCCRPKSFTFDFFIFFLYSSYNNFLFLFVPTKSCMIFSIISDSFSRHSTMYVQMYKVGENVTYSNGHLSALPGELLAY